MRNGRDARRRLLPAVAAAALAFAGAPAHAMIINPVFDSSITSLPAASLIKSDFITAANDYAKEFTSPATINILVSWGSVDGFALPASALGASVDPLYGYFTYAQVKSWLVAASANEPKNKALATAVAHLPATAPAGETRFAITSGEMKALGLIPGNQTDYDGYIGFSGLTSVFSFDPKHLLAGTYDFEAVAAHEIAEVLGRISGLDGPNPDYATPLDLFRYTAPGVRSFSYSASAYFSINGGVTKLGTFNNYSNGDRGDWQTGAKSQDVQDAFVQTKTRLNLTAADITALDVLGWGGPNAGNNGSPSAGVVVYFARPVPEPGTLPLFAAALAGFGFTRRRRA